MDVRPTHEVRMTAERLADTLRSGGHIPDKDGAMVVAIGDGSLHLTLMCNRCFYVVISDMEVPNLSCLDTLMLLEKEHPNDPRFSAQARIAEYDRVYATLDTLSVGRG